MELVLCPRGGRRLLGGLWMDSFIRAWLAWPLYPGVLGEGNGAVVVHTSACGTLERGGQEGIESELRERV